MPQNNNDIVNSQGYKDFIKKANIEVFNLESINILLYSQSILIQKLEERLLEVGKNVAEWDLISHADYGLCVVSKVSLADKWK